MRLKKRYPLRLTGVARFGSSAAWLPVRTIDVSSAGVAFELLAPGAPTNAHAELKINWPVTLDDGTPLALHVNVRVVRASGNPTTFAGVWRRYEFRVRSRSANCSTAAA